MVLANGSFCRPGIIAISVRNFFNHYMDLRVRSEMLMINLLLMVN